MNKTPQMAYYILNCTENAGGFYLYFARAFFKYKVTYPMQTDSKFAIFYFLLICILMGKGLNKLGEFNCIYKSFNVFCPSNLFVACTLTI